ncbi:MAG: hypothetical protein IKE65_04700 [Clostridia bacterium]|nr:hypothetical protein [Clostridia bacterium]
MKLFKLIFKIVCGVVIVAAIAVGAYLLINKFVGDDEDEEWDEFDCFECECDDCEGCELNEAAEEPAEEAEAVAEEEAKAEDAE